MHTTGKLIVFALVSVLSTFLLLSSFVVEGCQNNSECNYPFQDNALNVTMEGINLVCINQTCGCDESTSYHLNQTFCAPLCSSNGQCGHGVCNMTFGICECNEGFVGVHCNQSLGPLPNNNNGSNPNPPVDPCANVKCGVNQHCNNGSCICDQGFAGPQCDQQAPPNNNGTNNNGSNPNPPVDPCVNVQCKNGNCVNGSCVCNQGFVGPQCDQQAPPNNNGTNNNGSNPNPPVDRCANVKCDVNQHCNNGSCICDQGFAGPKCDQPLPPNNNGTNNNGSNPNPPVDPCANIKCGLNQHCNNGSCICDQGFAGPQCDQQAPPNNNGTNNNGSNPNPPVDPCANVKCGLNQHCNNGSCVCNQGFVGPQCDQQAPPNNNGTNNNGSNPNPPVDPCVNVKCGLNQHCNNGSCVCNQGFAGPKCDQPLPPNNNGTNNNGSNPNPPVNPCANVKCGLNQHCNNGSCVCDQGFVGPKCDQPLPPNNNGTNNNGSNPNPPVDPCANVPCKNGYCVNGVCKCNPGFVGPQCDQQAPPNNNGTNNNGSNPNPPVDRCANVKCDVNQHCNNGSCVCNQGFAGPKCDQPLPPNNNGTNNNGSNPNPPVDPCANVPCKNGYCVNGVCKCNPGFVGPQCDQQAPPNNNGSNPVYPCENVKCGSNQHCFNGSCVCNQGYTGVNCDVFINNNGSSNNCGQINCNKNQHCMEGGICACNEGFIGIECSVFIEPKCENVLTPAIAPFCLDAGVSFPVFNYRLIEGLASKTAYNKVILENAKILDTKAKAIWLEGQTMNPNCKSESCLTLLKRVACMTSFSPCANNTQQMPCRSFCKSSLSEPQLSPEFVNNMKCDDHPDVKCFAGPFTNNTANPITNKCQGVTCSGNGVCLPNTGLCQCYNGFVGIGCDQQILKCNGFLSTDINVCSRNGECLANDKCECKSGYKGRNCEEPDCLGNPCKNGGKCSAPNVCTCPVGFGSTDCSTFLPNPTCMSVMSPQNTPFCSGAGVNHPLFNLKLIPENATVSTKEDFESKMKAFVRETDKKIETDTMIELQGLTNCKSTSCILQYKRLKCYNRFKPCLGSALNSAELCRGACEILIDQGGEGLNITKETYCAEFPVDKCASGVFVAENTTCFGKPLKAGDACNSKGRCVGQDQCSCFTGFTGNQCDMPMCFGKAQNDPNACGGASKGKCVAPNTCNCRPGANGLQCENPTCNGKTEQAGGCSFNGICSDVDKCVCRGNFDSNSFCMKCNAGYTGPNCEVPTCFNIPATDRRVCNGKGSCEGPNACKCETGFGGSSCQSFECYGVDRTSPSACGGHGKCVAPNTCSCESAWNDAGNCTSCSPAFKGANCGEAVCTDEGTCKGRGKCQGLKCVCNGNFAGEFCEKCIGGFVGSDCSITCGPSTCSGRGSCKSDGSCECKSANADPAAKCAPGKCINNFEGDNCDYKFDTSSLKFNANGDRLTATVYSSLKRPIPCDQIFQDASKLGDRSQCVFNNDKNTLDVILGPNANIVTGDALKAFKYPASKDVNDVILLAGDFTASAPTASLIGDKSIVSSCDDLFLNAYGSISLDRRPLNFTWSVSSGPSTDDEQILSNAISSEVRGGLRIKFSGLGLSAGTYIVDVAVTSKFGKTDTKSFSFTIVASAVPAVFIKQGAESKFMIGSVSTITPVIKFPGCYSGNGEVTYEYSLDASQSVASVTPVTKNGLLVLGKGFTNILLEGDYYFTVKATANGAQSTSTSFKVTAIAQPLALSYTMDDIIQSVHDPISFAIKVVDPSATSDAQNVTMTCYDLTNGQDCAIQPGNVDSFSSSSFSVGSYVFTTTVTKGSRVASRYFYVTLLDQTKDSLLKVSITSNVDLTVVDPSKDLYLTYSTWGAVLTSPSFEWTAEDFTLDANASTTASYLKISSSLLSPGDTYTLSLKVVDGKKTGSAKVSFTVNTPPTQGQFDVYPTSGKALSDTFDLKCGNGWSDPQTPLTYQFMFYDKTNNKWNPLTDRTEEASASILLPQPTTGSTLTVKAVVYDSLGASSFATFDVEITKPSTQESVTALSSMASSKGTVTLSAASSAMSVISGVDVKTLSPTQLDAIKQAASAIADAFLDQQAKTENITSVSKTTAENGLSFTSSFSNSASSGMVPDSTTSKVVEKLAGTTGSVIENGIELGNDMINNVMKSTDKFLEVISKNLQKKRSFSKVDLSNINSVYTSLASLSVKDSIADLPSTIVVAGGITTLTRKVNVATLNSFSEKISGNNKIRLSSKFSQLNQLASHKTINVMAKVIDVSSDVNNTITKAIDFKLVDGSTTISLSNSSSICDLEFEIIKKRSLMASTQTCKVLNPSTNTYETDPGCTLTTNNDGTLTASVSATGTYIITSDATVDPATSTVKPNTSVIKPPTPTPTKSTKISASSRTGMNILVLLILAILSVVGM